MPRLFLPCLLLLGLLLPGTGTVVEARDADDRSGPTPAKNFSNIHSDTDWVVAAFKAADAAHEAGDDAAAVRTLQGLVDEKTSRESPGDAAPYVAAVHGTAVFEGAWIVARHRVARWGARALASYAREFGATARALLRRAATRRDPTLLDEVARRFLPLAEGRQAALLLIDLALERGDLDAALEWIEALEDLESVSGETPEALAPWRAARIRRHAVALAASPEKVAEIERLLSSTNPRDGLGLDVVRPELRRRPPAPRTWPTTAGNAARAAVPAALGARFRLKWFRPPSTDDDLADSADPRPRTHDRPSIWLPPRAVASDEHLFVSDGQYLHVYRLKDGARVLERSQTRFPRARRGGHGTDTTEDRRKRYGLLEGHALTLQPVRDFVGAGPSGEVRRAGPGWLVLASVPDGNPWPLQRTARESRRNDHVQAWHWDPTGQRLTPLWWAGGRLTAKERFMIREGRLAPGLPDDTRLYGAPLFYRGRVWVAGVRPARATNDRWEAWVYSLEPATGRVLSRTNLGTGTPMRTGRMDEVIPTSPAGAHGRVVVGTALGILGALDASDGRIQWIYRYDRFVETDRGRRRNRNRTDEGNRPASFANEPPVLALDRCFITPTDSNKVVVVFNRPRTARRSMLSHGRTHASSGRGAPLTSEPPARDEVSHDFQAEHIAGVVPGGRVQPSSLLLVGQGANGPAPGPIVVSLLANDGALRWPLDEERSLLWREESMTGFGSEPFGRALVTEAEIFVPTRHGIVIYETKDRDGNDTHYLGLLDRDDVPAGLAGAPGTPYGNLIPIPGRGLVSVSASTVAFWERLK